jgi:7-cyano-7-deazaguanine reductase
LASEAIMRGGGVSGSGADTLFLGHLADTNRYERMPTTPSKTLETFPNPHPNRDYEVEFTCPEFTCVCPMTGQPDFANFTISYVPDQTCVELKSLKLYLWSFRDEGHFHEDVTNLILNDLVAATDPRRMTIEGEFNVRGGIRTVVRATHTNKRALAQHG